MGHVKFKPPGHMVLGFDTGADSPRVEDVAEPIRAYRWWNVKPDGNGGLFSVSYYTKFPWPSTGIEAECGYLPWFLARVMGRRPPCRLHVKPFARTMEHGPLCGIYAFRSVELAFERWHGHVLGEVLLGGRVVPHQHGYRAEKAKISSLICTDQFSGSELDQQLALASRRYDVPIEFRDGRQLTMDVWNRHRLHGGTNG